MNSSGGFNYQSVTISIIPGVIEFASSNITIAG
jgi:hypothetical protein